MKKHLLQAAERGDAEAQFNLGIMYENGLEDSRYALDGRNRPEAVRWLLAAAKQGLPRAQFKLAEMYAGELEIPGNSVKACGWYLLAMTSLRGAHLQKAQSAYQRASFGLTPSQMADARRFAQDWKPKAPTIAALSDQPEMPEGGRA
ncbi:MAG: tetratricopeptide repeat protein [Acetobacteraceae bacterium]